ncbi:MAG TPA: BON domain-containing protein [Candidatus Acidoferrum sp.]|nr:BON domain-containing protein [Candidatus Acidoferrum sp.]
MAPILLLGLVVTAPFLSAQRRPAAKQPVVPPVSEEPQLPREIRHQLAVLPYYSVFDYISFTVDKDRVTLTGYVVRPTLRADAEAAIKSLEGVASVKNEIEVLPKSSSDDDIRRAVYRAIFEDPVLQRYAASNVPQIHILLKNGEVTLEGAVSSEREKTLAAALASGVSGVSGVKNNIVFRPKADSSN